MELVLNGMSAELRGSCSCQHLFMLLLLKNLLLLKHQLLLLYESEVLDEASEVEIIVDGVDPEAPVEVLEEGYLKKVQLFEGHTPDVSYKVVPVEYVVVEFGGH